MQTFLPFPDFYESAAVLDRQRLGKQRVENLQIMATLLYCHVRDKDMRGNTMERKDWKIEPNIKSRGWAHHPAVLMWKGYELGLLLYQEAIVSEWEARGYVDKVCMAKTAMLWHNNGQTTRPGLPPWLGDEEFHISHQSNLLRKDPDHYEQFFPGVPHDLPYIWPTTI